MRTLLNSQCSFCSVRLDKTQVNSEPRGRLAWMSPAKAFEAALGEDARALMDAFGVEALGPDDLDLTPGCVARSRASRGLPPLAG